jgi:hypothetical protein
MKMTEFLKKLFFGDDNYDRLVEGMYAHNYTDESVRQQIAQDYKKKFTPVVTPFTNPEQYDPLNPPEGWMYDPYYELWIKI